LSGFGLPVFWQGKCISTGMVARTTGIQISGEFQMFSGKFNPLLDSYLFRTALTVAGFVAWMGVTYFLLSV
jgi:hypothetical protein